MAWITTNTVRPGARNSFPVVVRDRCGTREMAKQARCDSERMIICANRWILFRVTAATEALAGFVGVGGRATLRPLPLLSAATFAHGFAFTLKN